MPIVQLNFNNPLNVSVQIGDIAYFINPSNVGPDKEWADTHTPHITGGQGGIIEIGRIVNIFQWDGTTSYIQCDMDQLMFNQYFAQLQEGICTTVLDYAGCSGECCNYTDSDIPPIGEAFTSLYGNIYQYDFFFDNPTFSVNDYMLHTTSSILPAGPPVCLVSPDDPDYVDGLNNYWMRLSEFCWTDPNGVLTQNISDTAVGFIDWLMLTYPGVYSQGMSWEDIFNARDANGDYLGQGGPCGGGPVRGTLPSTTSCTPGSFIMFSKDNKVNMSSVLGYYASVELRNNSLGKAELFNVGTSFFESSK